MEEEGSWPRLGLLLLSGVAVLWLVLLLAPRMIVGSGGFYSPTPRGYNGNVISRWVRVVGVRGPGLGPAEGLWFAGFPYVRAPHS